MYIDTDTIYLLQIKKYNIYKIQKFMSKKFFIVIIHILKKKQNYITDKK